MGWLVSALIALLVLSVVAFVAPAVFGPVVAGVAPILAVVAAIGIGAVWWRHSQRRVDPEGNAGADADGGRDRADRELRGEDEGIET